ncbi:hypothetical protein [Vibrio phage vB_VpP_DE17]|uniref:Uncharacterized protein n=2 Tax=Maculvirus TaxID=2731958 RepID=A0A7T1TTP4_9CAUD|nr:hypothetical protein [Vibrio phage vB_VpP_DE17]QWY13594.1 putative structural protein [Vibrio phage vB_VpP_DE18]
MSKFFQPFEAIQLFGVNDPDGYKLLAEQAEHIAERFTVMPAFYSRIASENVDFIGASGKVYEHLPRYGKNSPQGEDIDVTSAIGKETIALRHFITNQRGCDDRKLEALVTGLCPDWYSTQVLTAHHQRGLFDSFAGWMNFGWNRGGKAISPRTTLLREKFEMYEGTHRGWVFKACQRIARLHAATNYSNMADGGYESVQPNVNGTAAPDVLFMNARHADMNKLIQAKGNVIKSVDFDTEMSYEMQVHQLSTYVLEAAKFLGFTHPKLLAFAEEYCANLIFLGADSICKGIRLAQVMHECWYRDYDLHLGTPHMQNLDDLVVRFLRAWNCFFQNQGVTPVGLIWDGESEVKQITAKPTAVVTAEGRVQIRIIINDLPIPRLYADGSDYRDALQAMKALNSPIHTTIIPAEPEYDRIWHFVYENGPGSCMTDYPYERCPVRVYCHEDNSLGLAVCYRSPRELTVEEFNVLASKGELDTPEFSAKDVFISITGRAVCNIDDKQYVRSYGCNTEGHLMNAGYNHNSNCLDGQELRYIEYPNSTDTVLMPYLDGYEEHVELCDGAKGKYWRVCDGYSDSYEAQSASGYIEINLEECYECSNRTHEDDMCTVYEGGHERQVCESCRDQHYVWVDHDQDYHHQSDVTYSEYTGEYILDYEVEVCPLVGPMHEDRMDECAATGKRVFEDRLQGGCLTATDAEQLGVINEWLYYHREDEE